MLLALHPHVHITSCIAQCCFKDYLLTLHNFKKSQARKTSLFQEEKTKKETCHSWQWGGKKQTKQPKKKKPAKHKIKIKLKLALKEKPYSNSLFIYLYICYKQVYGYFPEPEPTSQL